MLLMNPEKDGAIPAHMAPTPGPKMIRSQWIHLDKKKPGLIGRTGLSWTLMDQSGVDHILSIKTCNLALCSYKSDGYDLDIAIMAPNMAPLAKKPAMHLVGCALNT